MNRLEIILNEKDFLTTDKLRLEVERLWIQHIKLCQDNFLYFVQEMWQDFICRKEKDPSRWGHHQIIAKSVNTTRTNINIYQNNFN